MKGGLKVTACPICDEVPTARSKKRGDRSIVPCLRPFTVMRSTRVHFLAESGRNRSEGSSLRPNKRLRRGGCQHRDQIFQAEAQTLCISKGVEMYNLICECILAWDLREATVAPPHTPAGSSSIHAAPLAPPSPSVAVGCVSRYDCAPRACRTLSSPQHLVQNGRI